LGSNYFEQLHRYRLEQNLVQRLEKLGYKVTLEANSESIAPAA